MNDDETPAEARYWAWLASSKHFARLPGVLEHDVLALDRYGASGGPGSGLAALIRFALGVWNARTDWLSGPFRVDDVQVLDADGRAWIAEWFQEPWFP